MRRTPPHGSPVEIGDSAESAEPWNYPHLLGPGLPFVR